MNKILATTCFMLTVLMATAQQTDTATAPIIKNPPSVSAETPKKWNNIDLTNRSNDHFMLQYGIDNWSGGADSTNPSGFSRHFNMYFMLDKPFKNSPKFSVGIGVGVGSSNMFFERKTVDLKSNATRLPFTNRDSADHFKKYKLTTVYAEAPIELRFASNPLSNAKSLKAALGLKIGTMINAHTKGKTLEDKNGQTLNNYILKENTRKFFNTTRLAVTGRFGYGILSLYGSYQVNTLLKDGAGPDIRPYSIGICISGL